MSYGFIYITTNTINSKRYLGMCAFHKTNHKTYLGSGKALKRAIKKYGYQSFSREIVHVAETKEELSHKEIELITEYGCVDDRGWYNLAPGGYTTRGFLGKKHSEETRYLMKKNHKRILTPEGAKRIGDACKKRMKEKGTPTPPKSVTVDGVQYVSLAEAIRQTGVSYHRARVLAGLVKTKPRKPIGHTSCPHCDKVGSLLVMSRWHLDNCKLKDREDDNKFQSDPQTFDSASS